MKYFNGFITVPQWGTVRSAENTAHTHFSSTSHRCFYRIPLFHLAPQTLLALFIDPTRSLQYPTPLKFENVKDIFNAKNPPFPSELIQTASVAAAAAYSKTSTNPDKDLLILEHLSNLLFSSCICSPRILHEILSIPHPNTIIPNKPIWLRDHLQNSPVPRTRPSSSSQMIF